MCQPTVTARRYQTGACCNVAEACYDPKMMASLELTLDCKRNDYISANNAYAV